MKSVFSALVIASGLILSLNCSAAQESYGVPYNRPGGLVAGGVVVHQFNCSMATLNGRPLLGVMHTIECSTAAVNPMYTVRGCQYKHAPLVPNAVWSTENLPAVSQDMQQAVFASENTQISIDKSTYSAVVQFRGGATMTCTAKN